MLLFIIFPLLLVLLDRRVFGLSVKLDDTKKIMETKNNSMNNQNSTNGSVTILSNGKPIKSWRSLEGKYPKHLNGIVKINENYQLHLNLEQNTDLLTSNYKEAYTIKNDLNDFCYYHGTVSDVLNSYAAVNICKGKLEGTFHIDDQRFFLESTNDSTANVFENYPNEATQSNLSCGFKNTNLGYKPANFTRKKRAINLPSYYSKYVKWDQLYVEFAIIFDNSMYRKFNRDVDLLNDRAKRLANLMNAFYQPVNIKIALVGVEVWTEGDRITVNNSGDTTLDQFHRYRKMRLLNEMRNDNAQLITDVPFNGGVVGKALKGTMCSSEMSDAVVNDHSSKEIAVAATMAHEMGHNFGMEHDNETCECPNDRCIMAASSGNLAPFYWSTCSLEYLSWSLSHGGDFCLKNVPNRFFASPTCGNGFTEPGEECDCGLPDTCTNKCCNSTVCKFNTGAVCATGDCCDESSCTLKPLATVCRGSTNDCDLSEYCNGKSEVCPADTYKHDGLACNSNSAFCFEGRCASHDDQCKLIWGSTGTNGDSICYSLNTKGDPQGNCGMHRNNNTYIPCDRTDIECGLLQCTHKNEKTVFGDKPVVRYTNTILRTSADDVIVCQAAMIDLGSDNVDPGLVPSGAKCGLKGDQKMCSNRKCVDSKEILHKNYCQNNCQGVGVCNNLAHCHCDPGYGGVDCSIPGLGGSVDSGPATVGGQFNIGLGVLIFLFVVIPIIILVVTFLYRRKIIKAPKMKIIHALFPSTTAPNAKRSKPTPASRPPAKLSQMTPQQPASIKETHPADPYYSRSNVTTAIPFPVATPRFELETKVEPPAANKSCESTLNRKPSIRPNVPAPPRPRRPDDAAMEKLYAEAPELAPSGGTSMLSDVLTVLDGDAEQIVPHRRAPPPPANHFDPSDVAPALGGSVVNVAEKKKMFEGQGPSPNVLKTAAATTISHPVNPIIGGEPAHQAAKLTVVSSLENETLPRRNKPRKDLVVAAALSGKLAERRKSTDIDTAPGQNGKALLPPAKIVPGDRLQRSVSSVSNNGTRPGVAPPLPPKPSNLTSDLSGEENYYDIIPSPSNDKRIKEKNQYNDDDLYDDIDEYRVDKKSASPPQGKVSNNNLVGKLAQNFEPANRERSKSPLKK